MSTKNNHGKLFSLRANYSLPRVTFALAALCSGSLANANDQLLFDTTAAFSSIGQSMWGSGEAFIFDYNQFVGIDSNPDSVSVGSGSGDTINYSSPIGTYSINPYMLFDSSFKAGIEVGASINSGSIDTQLDYGIQLRAPNAIRVGESFNLSGSSNLLGSSGFTTTPAQASAYVDGVVEAYLATYARVEYKRPGLLSDQDLRLGNKGFTINNSSNSPYYVLSNINKRTEIIGVNRPDGTGVGSGVVRYLGGNDLTDGDLLYDELGQGSSASLGPIEVTAGSLNVTTAGGLDVSGAALSGSGQETLVSVTMDIDQLIVGSPALGQGLAHDWGDIAYDLGYDVVDLDAVLDIGLQQNFNVDANLFVQLAFSDLVYIEGIGETTSYLGLLETIPAITLLTSSVDVTTSFLVEAMLLNDTSLAFQGSLNTTLMEAHANLSWDVAGNTGSRGYQIGPAYQNAIPVGLGDISVYSDQFSLAGFGTFSGPNFTLSAVPLPPALWLFGAGLIGLVGVARKNS